MTGILIGLSLKYLPWQLAALIMFALSILCLYVAVTTKRTSKAVNILCICGAIGLFFVTIELLAKNIGVFSPYLSIIETLDWIIFFVTIILIFFFFMKIYRRTYRY